MSFGFSIGDIIAVSQLANKVRRGFVDAPDQYRAISDERERGYGFFYSCMLHGVCLFRLEADIK
jgi:hypothetical protein